MSDTNSCLVYTAVKILLLNSDIQIVLTFVFREIPLYVVLINVKWDGNKRKMKNKVPVFVAFLKTFSTPKKKCLASLWTLEPKSSLLLQSKFPLKNKIENSGYFMYPIESLKANRNKFSCDVSKFKQVLSSSHKKRAKGFDLIVSPSK